VTRLVLNCHKTEQQGFEVKGRKKDSSWGGSPDWGGGGDWKGGCGGDKEGKKEEQ